MRKFFSLIAKFFLIALALGAFFWIFEERLGFPGLRLAENSNVPKTETVVEARKIPELSGPKETFFRWEYAGRKYEIKEILYSSTYDFYKNSPKNFEYTGELPTDWEEKYFGIFLADVAGDNSISELAQDIKNLGIKNKLSDDQIIELAMAFVQAIPYDTPKAEQILSKVQGNQALISYPYEVLYENKGVCSDKSFLGWKILEKLGYGSALFAFDAENHMALGIRCPQEYSSYNSGYCYAEMTAEGSKIGLVPALDPKTNRAVVTFDISNFQGNSSSGEKALSQVEIYQKRAGSEYRGIIRTISTIKKINILRGEITSLNRELMALKAEINSLENEVKSLQNKMEKLLKNGKVSEYNKLVDDYNDLAKKYKKKIDTYNGKVNTYNQKIGEYNGLVKII